MKQNGWAYLCMLALLAACSPAEKPVQKATAEGMGLLKIADNGRYFTDEKGGPFFWLGDTGWLLLSKLDREETLQYLDDREQKGYNVVQVMVLHNLAVTNAYGDSALSAQSVALPVLKEGNEFGTPQYDYWDHIDWTVSQAEERGLYMALVPVWGSNVKAGMVSREEMQVYGEFIAKRYRDRKNIIWLNGGDIFATDSTATWQVLGNALREHAPDHLITFHPRGRTQSSVYFHNEPWLDFNMFQSGHRTYAQDTASNELRYGEDNWRYVEVDHAMEPPKPTLDGEPSYEGIPQGLHDFDQPLWTDKDLRRYGYWSVFAGAAGYTYGHSAVMQMHKTTDTKSSYGNTTFWYDALDAPGAGQMVHLKNLMLSRPYFGRCPDQEMVTDQGEKYDYIIATRGENYAFVYTYTGRGFNLKMGRIEGEEVKVSWFDPRTGEISEAGTVTNKGTQSFGPPGQQAEGNDWVLILDSI